MKDDTISHVKCDMIISSHRGTDKTPFINKPPKIIMSLAVSCRAHVLHTDMKRERPDKDGAHRGAFEKNKKKIYATQTVCGICGKPVDFSLKYPHPLAPCIDHIIPIARGGHPSDLDNLQLAHWTCNRQKSDKLVNKNIVRHEDEAVSNRMLPQSIDWTKYRA